MEDGISGLIPSEIPEAVNRNYRDANTAVRRDPLAIDLDKDGIETVGINTAAPILFDHNGDGNPTATGWLKGDDAWLVRDLNANGTIDSGLELFGVDTDIIVNSVTRKATNGFEALAVLDTNGDKNISAAEAQSANLKLWQDLNQNGISEANELSTWAAQGITGISLNYTSTNTNLGNGNTVTGTAVVSRNGVATEADQVTVGVDTTASNLNLAENPFYQPFKTTIPLSDTAASLPQMNGSGRVRNLREAMSLGTDQATALSATVAEFAAAQTRDAQMALVDKLVQQWGATSDLTTSGPLLGQGVVFDMINPNYTGPAAIKTYAQQNPEMYRKVIALEQFNGQSGLSTLLTRWGVTLPTPVVNSLNSAYDALKQSVYAGLALQTRLAPYFSAVNLVVSDRGLSFDATGLASLIEATSKTDTKKAISDLADLTRLSGTTLSAVGFDGLTALSGRVNALPGDSPIRSALSDMNVFVPGGVTGSAQADIYIGNAGNNGFSAADGNDQLSGSAGNDTLYGAQGNDTLNGEADQDALYGDSGNDLLLGGAGNDTIMGGIGDDTIDGGAGNDTLTGEVFNTSTVHNGVSSTFWGLGNDTYRFGKGDGQDTIWDFDTTAGNIDTIEFKEGVNRADVTLTRTAGGWVIFAIKGVPDTLTVAGYFESGTYTAIEQVKFADGSSWDYSQIRAQLLIPTSGNDALRGYDDLSDNILGDAGNDTLYGAQGNDTLNGEADQDALYGDSGNDLLLGGAGNDTIMGGIGDDTIDGGAGNDTLTGEVFNTSTVHNGVSSTFWGLGNDTYRFGKGDGQDTIWDFDTTAGNIDTIEFKAELAPSNFTLKRSGTNLLMSINGTTDALTVVSHFESSTNYRIELLRFGDGTAWDIGAIDTLVNATPISTSATTVNLTGSNVNDQLKTTTGNDTLTALSGNDFLFAGSGEDSLLGGEGNDWLYGEDGNDTLDGGTGNDTMLGGSGSDYYYVNSGSDLVIEQAPINEDENLDIIETSVTYRAADNVEELWAAAGAVGVDLYANAKGTDLWGNNMSNHLYGSDNGEILCGVSGSDSLYGGGGDDFYYFMAGKQTVVELADQGSDSVLTCLANTTLADNVERLILFTTTARDGTGNAQANFLQGNQGSNLLKGMDGNDQINAGGGNDTLVGGVGNDTLVGANGNDTYLFTRGDGVDKLIDTDTTAGNQDHLSFDASISHEQLWLSKSGQDLLIQVVGSTDQVRITNWYMGAANQVEFIEAGGKSLSNSQVNTLVDAMATLTPPAAGQTSLSAATLTQLTTTLKAAWGG